MAILTDIVGNPRIFLREIVDIGPYEVQRYNFSLSADKLKSVFQTILTIDEANSQFVSSDPVFIYKDVWSQFETIEAREEFARGAKIVLQFKVIDVPIKLYNDKEDIFLAEFEAYFDAGTLSIIFTKSSQNLGYFLSTIFDDGRYIFDFNDVEHKLSIYINSTYNKGRSGKSNIVNEVRIGGSSIISG